MTRAVCLQCGGVKHGAWTPCPGCSYDPAGRGLEEEARALYLTDHYRSGAELDEAGAAIREGRPPVVDAAFVASVTAEAQARGARTLIPRARMALACGGLLVVVGALIAGLVLVFRACG